MRNDNRGAHPVAPAICTIQSFVPSDSSAAPPATHPQAVHRIVFRAPRSAFRIALLGVLIEAALIVGLVQPLWLFGPRWMIRSFEPLATALGMDWAGLLRFVVVLAVWIGGFAIVMQLSRQALPPVSRRLLVVFPAVFAVTLWFMLPASSQDVYHYVMEGRILALYGDNPLQTPPSAYPTDPLAWVVRSWANTPSRYGPAFALVAGAVSWIGRDSLTVTLIGFKLVATAALFGAAVLAWLTMRRVRPEAAWPAFVLVAWNPLGLYEAAANAHNDLLMLFFTALALYCWSRGRIDLALPALAMGVLVKYVVVLLAPLIVYCGLRIADCGLTERRIWACWVPSRRTIVGIGLSVALVVALYVPFWEGAETFRAVTSASGDMVSSPGWLLRQALKHWLGWDGARPVVVIALGITFALGYMLIVARHIRAERAHATAVPRPQWDSSDAIRNPQFAIGMLMLWLCTVSWWLWPWYAVWLLPPAALLTDRRIGIIAAVATCSALAAYVPVNFHGMIWGYNSDWMPLAALLTMFVPPLATALALALRGRAT